MDGDDDVSILALGQECGEARDGDGTAASVKKQDRMPLPIFVEGHRQRTFAVRNLNFARE